MSDTEQTEKLLENQTKTETKVKRNVPKATMDEKIKKMVAGKKKYTAERNARKQLIKDKLDEEEMKLFEEKEREKRKKTKKKYVVSSSDESSSDDEYERKRRKKHKKRLKKRNGKVARRKAKKSRYRSDSDSCYTETDDEDSEEYYEPKRRKARPKVKAVRRKAKDIPVEEEPEVVQQAVVPQERPVQEQTPYTVEPALQMDFTGW